MTCYTLFSGSSGNCIYLKEGKSEILIDAGGSMRAIECALQKVSTSLANIKGIFITHEHSDHTKGLAMIAKHHAIPIFCQNEVAKEMYLYYLNRGNTAEAAALARWIRTVKPGEEYEWGDFVITPFKTPHDSVDSQGFVLGDRKLGIATDLGHVSDEVKEYLLGCENVILESNHDTEMLYNGPYPPYLKERVASDHGHLNNRACADFSARLLEKGCRNFTLFHLSLDNNTPSLALEETRTALENKGAVPEKDFTLRVADRFEVTKVL